MEFTGTDLECDSTRCAREYRSPFARWARVLCSLVLLTHSTIDSSDLCKAGSNTICTPGWRAFLSGTTYSRSDRLQRWWLGLNAQSDRILYCASSLHWAVLSTMSRLRLTARGWSLMCVLVALLLLLLLGSLDAGRARVALASWWEANLDQAGLEIVHFAPGADQESRALQAIWPGADTDHGGKSPTESEGGYWTSGHAADVEKHYQASLAEGEKAFRLFNHRLTPASQSEDYADLERYGWQLVAQPPVKIKKEWKPVLRDLGVSQ